MAAVTLVDLPVVIDNRLRLPTGLPRAFTSALRKTFEYANPEFHKKEAMGFNTWGTPRRIFTWRRDGAESDPNAALTLPRGGVGRLRELAKEHGYYARFIDRRLTLPAVAWPNDRDASREYQEPAIETMVRREQGILRAPTGSGKTFMLLELLARLSQPSLVIMRDSNLLKQWRERAIEQIKLHPREIGVLQGSSKLRVGARLTLALQQTLWSKSFPIEDVAKLFGAVAVDEVHGVASATFQDTIDWFPARYRIGVSADETRKDKKEFLVYDAMGAPVYTIERDYLERAGAVLPVTVRLVPTSFTADWYRAAEAADRDFNKLLDEMTNDLERNELAMRVARRAARDDETPVVAFTHRIAHATLIADEMAPALGMTCGLLLGGKENATRFDEDKSRLLDRSLPFAAGTFAAIGQGIDLPAIRAGIALTPIYGNRQFFGQVRGRLCRPSKATGKTHAVLYMLWDESLYSRAPSTIAEWNDGRVEVLERGADVLDGEFVPWRRR